MRHLILTLMLVATAGSIHAGDSKKLDALRLEEKGLEKTILDHPDSALAHYQLGIVYRELGDNRSATTNLKAAIQGGFDNLGARLNLIEAAFYCGQSALALETAQRVLSSPVKSTDVLLRVGRLLFGHLFYKEGLRAFQLAQIAAPSAFEPRFRAALTCYLLEDYAATLDTLKPAGVRAFPASLEAASLEASAEAELGHVETAISLLRATIEAAPTSPHAYINLALIEIDRGRMSEANSILEHFRSIKATTDAKVFYRIRHNSCPEITSGMQTSAVSSPLLLDRGEFYYQLAKQLQAGFNFLSAAALAHLAQANEGNSARVLLVAGASCLNEDQTGPEAVTLLRGAIAADANLHEAYFLLGRAYTRQGRLEDAVKAYRKAAELHPEASYYVNLGKALSDPESAIVSFTQALTLDPSYAQANIELGRTYLEIGETGKGRQELEKAIELEPDLYEADYLLGRLLHQLGDEEQSHKLLTLFSETKAALMQQSVIGAGYVGDGH